MITRRTLLSGLAALCLATGASAEQPIYFLDDGAAIGGYDAVSYFESGAAQRGSPDFAVMWKGAVWHFASAEHLAAFEANPRAYAPQFGGYCAYGVSQGILVSTDPVAWKIVNGKLYLTHSPEIERMWEANEARNIHLAEQNWPAVLRD